MAIHKRTLSLALFALGALAVGATVGSGCAISRGDRSIVQPLALNKSQFEGQWYYQKTLIDAPYDAPGVFIGSTSDGFKIRWEVTERYLYAFTIQPNVRNADSTVAPVAAWPIYGHFTVRYMINYSTGQPSNIIGEDYADKPWYDRPHFRVSWDRTVITDFTDFSWIYQIFGYIMREAPANARPEQIQITPDYMDIVNEEIISPGLGPLISKLNNDMPVTSYRVKYRHSFRKIGKSTYTPQPMNDDQFEKFGYFRTLIINNHIDRGLVDWSYKYYANRHNVATQAELDDYKAKNTPQADRKPEQIVYYMSPNFPEHMKSTAHQLVADWNVAFQRALNRPGQKVLDLRENDHGLPRGQKRNIGDIRYKFIYWVDRPSESSPLGYGPSFGDTDTGEIVSSAAYMYGVAMQRSVNRFLLYYDMISGRYSDEDLRNGKDYLDIVNNFGSTDPGTKTQPLTSVNGIPIMPPAYQGFDIQKAVDYVKGPSFQEQNRLLRKVDRSAIQARLAMIDRKPSLKWAMMNDEMLRAFFPDVDSAKLRANIEDPAIQNVLEGYAHPANMMRLTGLRKVKEENDIFSRHNVIREGYIDPALSKFVQNNKHLSRSELESLMARMIFRWVEAHEFGHTLGLRHNFQASADEPNYFDEYFELKKKQGGNTPGEDKDPRHPWYYMYSSVMDYVGEMYASSVGVGKYDHAAIMYAYGNLLELTNQDELQGYLDKIEAKVKETKYYQGIFKELKVTKTPLQTFQGLNKETLFRTNQIVMKIEGILADGTTQPILTLNADDLSGRDGMRAVFTLFGIAPTGTRFYSDGTPFLELQNVPLKRRPYKFCSDELVGQNPYCNRWDTGANPTEIVENMIRRYDGFYPLRNWSRGQRYYRLSSGYLYGLISQFSVISIFYQNWIWRVINEADYDGSLEFYNQLAAISRGTAFLSRVIHTPEPGHHIYDNTSNSYVSTAQQGPDSLEVPIGAGRHFYSRLQQDELGLAMYRFERIGTLYDKYVALLTFATRDWDLAVNSLNFFYVNFADYFSRDDVFDLMTGAISGVFEKRFATTYKDRMIEPNFHPVLQYVTMYMAMTLLNSGFFGNTFTHYMTVAILGSGDSWTAPQGSKTISFTSTSGSRQFFAVQTADGRSISYKLVERGKQFAEKIKELKAAQPTSAVNQAQIQDLEAKLRWVETVLNSMKAYVSVFYED